MNITLTSLEALILKATHESLPCPDAAAMEAFCAVMRDATDGPQFATQALAGRIHSSNAREALLALTMLDRCMRRCNATFHAEVGKFRFLNEMIKLVSPKYFADRTAPEVRTRVLQLLHAWSIEYPKESKFKVAYDMLKNQGVVKETPPPLPPDDVTPPSRARAKNAIYEDEEKSKLLQKLLQSKKPEDLHHANRLIKTMVREEERRNEASSRRAHEVGSALDSAGLLRDMLQHAADASPDEEQLIHELHASCTRLRPVLQSLAVAETQQDSALEDILHASDVLDDVFAKYNSFISKKSGKELNKISTETSKGGDSLLDFAGACGNNKVAGSENTTKNAIYELGDIFSTESGGATAVEPLKPISLITSDDIELLSDKNSKIEGWNELDSLGEQLLKQSLPDNARRIESFNNKTTKKIPMNALEKSTPMCEPHNQVTNSNSAILDLDFFTKTPEEPQKATKASPINPTTSNDDLIVDISTDSSDKNNESTRDKVVDLTKVLNTKRDVLNENTTNNSMNVSDLKPLTDIDITLESVKPSTVPPVTAFEEEGGISVVVHFCKDRPRPDVRVFVVCTTSKHSLLIEDYKFQAVVPKGCRARLLAASGSSLLPHRPFVPPAALTQLLLLATPPVAASRVSLRFIITYTCEREPCSEMGQVDLPLNP